MKMLSAKYKDFWSLLPHVILYNQKPTLTTSIHKLYNCTLTHQALNLSFFISI